MSSSRQNSRFSTLNVFKFGAQKPPPPPPKDPYYLANHSLVSLAQTVSPESYPSNPVAPMSAGPAYSVRSPSPGPSYTTSSAPAYAPSRSTSSTSLSTESGSMSSRKGFFKSLSLGKRPKTPKSAPSILPSEQPLDPGEDPSISMPWNFQHNVHVDEAFVGLPPTWSASLAEMGFSEHEIAAIHARRNANRPTLYALSGSPASSTHSIVMRPTPRTTSLAPRDTDTSSQYSSSSYAADVSHNLSMSTDHSDTMSEVSLSSYITSRTMVRSPDVMSQFSHRTTPSPIPQAGPSRLLPPLSKDRPPQTPTKRSYHVTNESASIIHSPPPAYRSPQKESALGDVDEDLVLPPAMVNTEDELDEPEEESDLHALTSSRLSVLPPRLSLHQDTLSDLSNWSESLFSIIPSTPPKPGILENSNHAPQPAPPGSSNITPKRSNNRRTSVIPAHATSNSSSHIRQRLLQKPIPLQVRDERLTPPPSPGPPSMLSSSASSSPLWHEVYNLVSSPGPGSTSPGPSPLFTPSTPGPVISPVTSDELAHDNDELQVDFSRDKENRDSNMSTMTVTPATIVRRVSVVRRVRANVIQSPPRDADLQMPVPNISSASSDDVDDKESIRSARSNSPVSTDSNSSESSVANSTTTCATGSGSFDSRPQTLTLKETQKWKASGLLTSKSDEMPYVESSPQPSPLVGHFDHTIITTAAIRDYRDNEPVLARPSIVIDNIATELEEPSPWSAASTVPSPSTPAQRYPGWVTAVVRPLKKFINERLDPNDLFAELQEIAEGDSGSVYSARVVASPSEDGDTTFVAIKQVALLPSGSQKLVDLERELKLMKQLHHPQILSMDELYVDLVDDALWIKMELMDRSLADVLNLVDEGVEVLETHIAQFASDALKALSYLQIQEIAHRDIRSDNLLINGAGVVKLADFSHAVKVTRTNPMRSDPAGVIFWQAPEMRSAPYNALKVDVWGLGATAWELAQAAPPFAEATGASQLAERWPPLDQPADYSRSFHDFLQLCSEPSSSRPDPDDLLNIPFIRNAPGQSAVVELLVQCRTVEGKMARRQSSDSHGTIS